MADLMGLDVLMVVASRDFRDEEYREPAQALAHAKAGVVVASSSKAEATGMLGHAVTPDLLLWQVNVSKFAAVIFVGGSGASEYFDDPTAHKIARDALAEGKLVAAICIAPSTLANAGLLKNKKATCFPSERENLKQHGAKLVDQPVVHDGNILTADGPESARAFAKTLCDALIKTRSNENYVSTWDQWEAQQPTSRPEGP